MFWGEGGERGEPAGEGDTNNKTLIISAWHDAAIKIRINDQQNKKKASGRSLFNK